MSDLTKIFPLSSENIYSAVHVAAIYLSYIMFLVAAIAAVLYLIQDSNIKHKHLGLVFNGLPDLSLLDQLTYKSISLGFPMLTLGIVSGLLWAKTVEGTYWDLNIKQVSALVIWLLYAVILHVRLSAKIRGRKVAVLTILVFFVIIFAIGINCGGIQ